MKIPSIIRGITVTVVLATVVGIGCKRQASQPEPNVHGGTGHSHVHKSSPAVPPVKEAPSGGARCAAHHAPKAWCFICDPRLRDPGRLWCQEHNRYEDRCWLCHPEAQDKQRLWCREHSLYEDECFLCHPELRQKVQKPPTTGALLVCSEHGVPEAECAICRPDSIAQLPAGAGLKLRLPSTNSAAMVGVVTAAPQSGTVTEDIECVAEVVFNQNKLAQIVAPVSGILQTVDAELGARVEEKQTLAKIWSAAITEAVAKAVWSHQTLERERKLRANRVTSQAGLDEAEAAHRAVCHQLRTLGFTEEQIDELGKLAPEEILLAVRAPFTGEIIERQGVRGTVVEAGKTIYKLADTSTMWAMLQIPQSVLAQLQPGQQVELQVDALPGRQFHGVLTWIGPALDERTRMALARAEFPNPDGLLKDKMFARARIIVRQKEGALLVPGAALQYVQGRPVVFIPLAEDLYEVRVVRLGTAAGSQREIVAGLGAAERVAASRTFALKSALLISRLGPGCADD